MFVYSMGKYIWLPLFILIIVLFLFILRVNPLIKDLKEDLGQTRLLVWRLNNVFKFLRIFIVEDGLS